jgi:hypothetical protein
MIGQASHSHAARASVPRSSGANSAGTRTVCLPASAPTSPHGGSDRDSSGRQLFLEGIALGQLVELLLRNRLKVSAKYAIDLVRVANTSAWVSVLNAVESLLYDRAVAEAELADDPVFILGHWRSGTTYLHKLLSLDKRHTYPTLMQCSLPGCFLSYPRILRSYLAARIPERRPMDNVALGLEEPFEDEFALLKTTLMSPYLNLVFPRSSVDREAFCELDGMDRLETLRWKRALGRFVRKISYATGKRVILKSPTHTFRVRLLLEVFPNAKFVIIVRNPYTVFASTRRLWPRLLAQSTLQDEPLPDLDEMIFARYERAFEAVSRDMPLIPERNRCLVKYEDLVGNELDTVRGIYEHLGLGVFAEVSPALAAYLEQNKDYVRNTYELSRVEKSVIYRRWRAAFEAYGYEE